MPLHAERNSACVSSTDHGHLAQYGCDGTHKEAGRGSQLVEPPSLSLPHPVVWLWIWGTILLQLGQEGALYADLPHDIGLHNNGEEEQASAVLHVVRRGMKQGVIGSQWWDKHKVLEVAIAPKEPLWEWPGMNTFQGLVPYGHTAKKADLPHAFMLLLGFHTGAQGIHPGDHCNVN